MILVTSLTIDASLLRKLLRLWDESGDERDPFASVLITPLFTDPSTLRLVREELKERRGSTIYFDSGGYYAQQGKITFDELYRQLRGYYRDPANQWADWYVLPDNVPTSQDSAEAVERKVRETITAAKIFYAEMPSEIQERAMPVIQGHTFAQVNECIAAYREMGARYIGFGSFGTSGATNSINVADQRSAETLAHITEKLLSEDVHLHTFGISTPPAVYAFLRMGIYSFDSMAWLRSAGYGKVFLPFTRAYNVSHRSTRNSALNGMEFEELKLRTGHRCPFCESFADLRDKRLYRSLHNLVSVTETADGETKLSPQEIADLIADKSERYYKMFEGLYTENFST
jgi:hypothetical protein